MCDLTLDFFGWLGGIVESLFPWPFVALLVLFLAVRSDTLRSLILEILPMFRRIKIGIAEFELTDETRKAITHQASELNSFFSSYRKIDFRRNREACRNKEYRSGNRGLCRKIHRAEIAKRKPAGKFSVYYTYRRFSIERSFVSIGGLLSSRRGHRRAGVVHALRSGRQGISLRVATNQRRSSPKCQTNHASRVGNHQDNRS